MAYNKYYTLFTIKIKNWRLLYGLPHPMTITVFITEIALIFPDDVMKNYKHFEKNRPHHYYLTYIKFW